MALPEYVTRRGNRLWYRRAYPKELWPVTGPGAFALSLRTSDPKEAARARPEAERRYHAKVDRARIQLGRKDTLPPLSKPAAEAIAVRWFLRALDSAEDFRTAATPDTIEKAVDDAEWGEAEARRALALGDLWDERRLARCLREEAGFASEPVADETLARLLARGAVAAFEVESGRVRGQYGKRPSDPFFASAMDAPPHGLPLAAPPEGIEGKSRRTIADLETAFRAERFPQLSVSTQAAYEPVFRLLRETLGADKALASIGHEDGLRLFETAQAIPANANKAAALKGRPLRDQIEEGKRLGLPTLSDKTINDGYMTNAGTLFRFAQDRGWMAVNPVRGRRVRMVVAPGDRREPFRDRLPVLFGAAPWNPRDPTGGGHPIHYWGPLLALFHGLRLAEVAGLLIGDVGDEKGQPMLYIRAGQRGLKARGSRRDMPVHPELVRLGFLRFVEDRQGVASKGVLLFEGEGPNARGQWGVRFGRWFAALVRARGLEGRRLTLHALRHDFRDALREAGVDDPLADYLTGHALQGVRGVYGGQRPYSVDRLSAAIGKVRYPGLILPSAQARSKRNP